jgi:hypothetical protein
VQPLSPSNGVLLKALRVGKLAEENAADQDEDGRWIDRGRGGIFEVAGYEVEKMEETS